MGAPLSNWQQAPGGVRQPEALYRQGHLRAVARLSSVKGSSVPSGEQKGTLWAEQAKPNERSGRIDRMWERRF